MKSVCVYCGSSDRINSNYLDAAAAMGQELARQNIDVVYGGGSTGMMGRLANAALEAGGRVIGVIPEFFNTPVLVHSMLSELEVVKDMHTRKARMAEIADGFIALPGGFGTFDELFEIITWAQIGLHTKPIGLLNVNGYYNPLLNFLDHVAERGFIYPEHQDLILHSDEPHELFNKLTLYNVPGNLDRWVSREG